MGFSGQSSGGVGSEYVMDIAASSGTGTACSPDMVGIVNPGVVQVPLPCIGSMEPAAAMDVTCSTQDVTCSTVGSINSCIGAGSDIVELTPEGRPLSTPEELLVQAVPGNPSTLRLTWFYDEEVLEQLASPEHPLRRLTFEVRQQSEAAKGRLRTRIHSCSCRGLNSTGLADGRDVGEQEFEVRGCTPGRNYFFSVRAVAEFEVAAATPELRHVHSEFSEMAPWLATTDVSMEPVGMTSVASLDQSTLQSPTRTSPTSPTSLSAASPQPLPAEPAMVQAAIQPAPLLPHLAQAAEHIESTERMSAGADTMPDVSTRREVDESSAGVATEAVSGDAQARLNEIFREAKEATQSRMMEAVQNQIDEIRRRAAEACHQHPPADGEATKEDEIPLVMNTEGEDVHRDRAVLNEQIESLVKDVAMLEGTLPPTDEEKVVESTAPVQEPRLSRVVALEAQLAAEKESLAKVQQMYLDSKQQLEESVADAQQLQTPEIEAQLGQKLQQPPMPKSAFAQAFTSYCVSHGQGTEIVTDPMPAQAPHFYLIDNSQLQAATPGLAYRRSKCMDDKIGEILAWGSVVPAAPEDEDWIRVGNMFLPVFVNGCRVLLEVDKRSLEMQAPESTESAATTQFADSEYLEHVQEASLMTTEFECSPESCEEIPHVVTVQPDPLKTADMDSNAVDSASNSQAILTPTSAETTASSATPQPASPKSQAVASTTAAPEGQLLSSDSSPTAAPEQASPVAATSPPPAAAFIPSLANRGGYPDVAIATSTVHSEATLPPADWSQSLQEQDSMEPDVQHAAKTEVQAPTKVPMKAPMKSPVKSPVKAPMKAPAKASMKAATKSPVRGPAAQAGGHMDKWMSKILARSPVRTGKAAQPKKAPGSSSPRGSSPKACSPRNSKTAGAERRVSDQIANQKQPASYCEELPEAADFPFESHVTPKAGRAARPICQVKAEPAQAVPAVLPQSAETFHVRDEQPQVFVQTLELQAQHQHQLCQSRTQVLPTPLEVTARSVQSIAVTNAGIVPQADGQVPATVSDMTPRSVTAGTSVATSNHQVARSMAAAEPQLSMSQPVVVKPAQQRVASQMVSPQQPLVVEAAESSQQRVMSQMVSSQRLPSKEPSPQPVVVEPSVQRLTSKPIDQAVDQASQQRLVVQPSQKPVVVQAAEVRHQQPAQIAPALSEASSAVQQTLVVQTALSEASSAVQQPVVVQTALSDACSPMQNSAGQAPTHGLSFVNGEPVHIWSNSQNTWMTDGMVIEVLAVPRVSEGPSPPAGVMMPAGAVRISSSAGIKWIMPEMISTQLRKPPTAAFKKGDKVHVWSQSMSTWMTDGIVLETCQNPFVSEGGSVPAGTMVPIGAVKVASSAGMKWIMPDLAGLHIRKASEDQISTFTIVDGPKPEISIEVQKQAPRGNKVLPEAAQRPMALPTADDVGPTVMSLPKRVVRADSMRVEPTAAQRVPSSVSSSAPRGDSLKSGADPAAAQRLPGIAAQVTPAPAASVSQKAQTSAPRPLAANSPKVTPASSVAMSMPKTVAHSSSAQSSASAPLAAGPTIVALPKMLVHPDSSGSGADNNGLVAALAANGPTVMALPKTVAQSSAPSKGAEPLNACSPLHPAGPTVLAVQPQMVTPAISSPDGGPDAFLGPSNPTVMALPSNPGRAESFGGNMLAQAPGQRPHARPDNLIPPLPMAPNVMPPISNQPGSDWFPMERRPEESQRMNQANELQQRLMRDRQGMGYPMPALSEVPQLGQQAPMPTFKFDLNPPPAGPFGYAPTDQFDDMPPPMPNSYMLPPELQNLDVGGFESGNIGGHGQYILKVLTSNSRWEELYFTAMDNMEEVGSIFLRTHSLKDAFLAGLVDVMREQVASGQVERSVDVIDLL